MGSNVIGFDPKIKRYPDDVKKAKELLDKAGYPQGLEVKLYFSPDRYPKAKEVCQVIADQLAKPASKSSWCRRSSSSTGAKMGSTAASCRFIMSAGPRPMPNGLRSILRSGVSPRIQYKNPEFDRLIDEEQKTGDPKRVALLHQAGRILMEDVPFVPLYTLAEIYGVARNVIWKARPDEKIIAAEMKIK